MTNVFTILCFFSILFFFSDRVLGIGCHVARLYPSRGMSAHSMHQKATALNLWGGRGGDTSIKPGEIIIGGTDDRMDVRRTAEFLTFSMYDDMPRAQRKELLELEAKDLRDRYEAKVGGGRLPSALILAKEDQEIIGSVGLDCQVLNKQRGRFRDFSRDDSLVDFLDRRNPEEICVVLANLAVRRDRRGRGLARNLLAFAEEQTLAWGYKDLYLLVDATNVPAQSLYKSSGYNEIFRDEDATCVVYGNNNLRTDSCTNVGYRKRLANSKASVSAGNMGGIGDFFNGLFGDK